MHGTLQLDSESFDVEAKKQGKKIAVQISGKETLVALTPVETGFEVRIGEHLLHIEVTDEQRDHLCLSRHTDLSVDGQLFGVQFQPKRAATHEQTDLGEQNEGSVTALMPGTIFKLLVEEGQEVEAGEVLLILEAMKMENEIKAPISGIVTSLPLAVGTSVQKGEVLAQLEDPNAETEEQ